RPHELAHFVGHGGIRTLQDRVEVLPGVARQYRIGPRQPRVEVLRGAHDAIEVAPELDGAAEEADVGSTTTRSSCGGGFPTRRASRSAIPRSSSSTAPRTCKRPRRWTCGHGSTGTTR